MLARVSRFEDLLAWQKARALTTQVYTVTSSGEFGRDFGLRDQVRRAAVSVLSNISEGFERGKPSEFHQFLSIAKGSCAELRAQLYVACDVGYLDRSAFDLLIADAEEVARIIGGLRASIERKRDTRPN